MEIANIKGAFSVNIYKLSRVVNSALPLLFLLFFFLGYKVSFFFHFLTIFFFLTTLLNFYYRHFQTAHSLLRNFGITAQIRYLTESLGPEFRQYLFLSDTEEKPFNRSERSEVYRKARGIDSASAYGSLLPFNREEIKLRPSLFPMANSELKNFHLIFGEERQIQNSYTLKIPIIISAMSFGAIGEHAVRALARGAKKASILMNTGEGGLSKYHLMEDCDLIFQMGTAKFGCRNEDGSLNEQKLKEISNKPQVKMIEIKLSQGAKPGKGGLLPKEKITKEISEIRGVPLNRDVISPPHHAEAKTPSDLARFIKKVQDISELPVGIKLCLGRENEFRELILVMKELNLFPDYISIDGSEGGSGASPKSFMDDLGIPIFKAIPIVQKILVEEGVRHKLRLLAAGKLVSPGKQFMAFSMGADAIYTARGFMLSLGCIQALSCNKNNCPVGITTQDKKLQKGLDIETKSERVVNYVHSLLHEHREILAALGKSSVKELTPEFLFQEGVY